MCNLFIQRPRISTMLHRLFNATVFNMLDNVLPFSICVYAFGMYECGFHRNRCFSHFLHHRLKALVLDLLLFINEVDAINFNYKSEVKKRNPNENVETHIHTHTQFENTHTVRTSHLYFKGNTYHEIDFSKMAKLFILCICAKSFREVSKSRVKKVHFFG